MPALSSTMTEGKIVEWLKNPGDKVERGESVLVVESDKADMDVESFQDGYLAAVLMLSISLSSFTLFFMILRLFSLPLSGA